MTESKRETSAIDTASPSQRPDLLRLVRRAGLNLVDQVLSALTNIALSFLVARAVDARGYGAFAVAFLVFTVLIGLERALVGQPMSIRFSGATGAEQLRAVRAAIGSLALVTGAAGVVSAGAGLTLGGGLGATLLALAPVIPGLIAQDACRMIFFAQARPALAVLNDAIWTTLQFAVMAAMFVQGTHSPWPYVLAWGGAGSVAALVGLVQLRGVPRVKEALWWIRGQIDLTGYLLLEFLLGTGSVQGSVLLVGVFGSVDDVGSLRAAQTLLGPLNLVSVAITTFLLPEISRRAHLSGSVRLRVASAVSAGVLALSLAYGGVLLLVPDTLGRQLLGMTWDGASSVLLPMALASAAAGACLGPAIIVYAMGQARKTFLLHALEAPLLLACMATGVMLGGTSGAAWGMALSMTIMVPLWFRQLVRLLQTTERDEHERHGNAEPAVTRS